MLYRDSRILELTIDLIYLWTFSNAHLTPHTCILGLTVNFIPIHGLSKVFDMFLGPEKGILASLTLQLTLLIHGLPVIRFLHHKKELVTLFFVIHLVPQKGIDVLDLTFDLVFTQTFLCSPCYTERNWCPWPYIWLYIYTDIGWYTLHQRRALVSLTFHLTLHLQTQFVIHFSPQNGICDIHFAPQKGIGILDLTIDLAFTWTFCDTPCIREGHRYPWPYIWPCIYKHNLWYTLHHRRAFVSILTSLYYIV